MRSASLEGESLVGRPLLPLPPEGKGVRERSKEHRGRQPTRWEKTSAGDVAGNGLMSRTYRQTIRLNVKKEPGFKMDGRPE